MSFVQTVLLGAVAGFTIFLGLPFGRLRRLSARTRSFLSVLSAGILLFIFWDVLTQAHDILETALNDGRAGGSWVPFIVRGLMVVAGLGIGALGLGWLETRFIHGAPPPEIAGGSGQAIAEAPVAALAAEERRALAFGMMIAVAIGLHNFSEGLAIGVSARAGEIGLAGTLVVGFAVHNATEGFGIVGPLGGVRPTWGWLFLAGLVGGGPTFLGSLIGYRVTSEVLEIAFYALAAGAILYVVGQIWGSAQRKLTTQLVLTGLIVGFLIGLASDLIITAGGG
ncbi:MAG: ZIP family metal transporter [Actinomycetota bacterium]